MNPSVDIGIDIAKTGGLDAPVRIAASVFVPARGFLSKSPIVLLAFPGGGYSRSYYDMHIPGRSGYSLAEHLAGAGIIVVTCDHIGVGGSSPYEPFAALTKEVVLAVDQVATEAIVARLATGALAAGLPPMASPFLIGLGHSMGGYLLAQQQARYRTFHALGLLGWSHLPHPRAAERITNYTELLANIPDRTRPPRSMNYDLFYDERVPREVIEADEAQATRVYSWVLAEKPDIVDDPESSRSAKMIDVPLFLAFGAKDISPDPHREPACYPGAHDITTFVLPQSAHCFNFAPTRKLFFDRLVNWCHSLAAVYGPVGVSRA